MTAKSSGFDDPDLTEEQRHVLQTFVDKNPHLKKHVSTLFKKDNTNPFMLNHLTFPRGFSHISLREGPKENGSEMSLSSLDTRQTMDGSPSPRASSSSTMHTAPPFLLEGAKLNRHIDNAETNKQQKKNAHPVSKRDAKRGGLPNIKVTKFVDSDFGFHNERLTDTVGMSQQKNIRHRGQLKRDIEQVAKKHIYAIQTPSLNYRRCRTTQAVDSLKMTLASGKVAGFGGSTGTNNVVHTKISDFDSFLSKKDTTQKPNYSSLKSPKGTLPVIDYNSLRIVAKGQ